MAKSMPLDDRSVFRSRWPIMFLILVSAICAIYFTQLKSSYIGDKRTFEIINGSFGLSLIIFLSFYKWRKSMYTVRLGSTQSWLQAHVYIGIISTILIFMHSGFSFKWNFSYLLWILFFLTIISGIVGSLIYKTIPLSVVKYEREILTHEEILNHLDKYLKDADKSVSKTSDKFKEVYQKKIRPVFLSKKTKWKYLLTEEKELLGKRKKEFLSLKTIVPPSEVYDLNILVSILIEKEKLIFKWVKLRLLRAWLNFHMPLVFAMLTAVVFHVFSIIYF